MRKVPQKSSSISIIYIMLGLMALSSCVKSGEKTSSAEFSAMPLASIASPVIGGVDLEANPNLVLGYPRGADPASEVIISRNQYELSWNSQKRQINWASWLLQKADIGTVGRAGKFAVDPDLQALSTRIAAVKAVLPDEYDNSCFDRGHQAPSGDRTDSLIDNKETFLMSNIIPQTAYTNRVIWEHLEVYERQLATNNFARLAIFSGPVFGTRPGMIGPQKNIPVPLANFKIIVPLEPDQPKLAAGGKITAVIMPNITSKQTDPMADTITACEESKSNVVDPNNGRADDWMQYSATVREIEQQTGLDFKSLGIEE